MRCRRALKSSSTATPQTGLLSRTPPRHLLFSSLGTLALFLLGGCLTEFSTVGKDRCLSDSDCVSGRICFTEAGASEGLCVQGDSEAKRCRAADQDNDGAYTDPTCGPQDCDDTNADANPDAEEVCDNEDNDCDGVVDENVVNACGACGELPAETCNGLDDDCDGFVDDDVRNACGACAPVAEEYCDRQDNDCDGRIDEGAVQSQCACVLGEARACSFTGPQTCTQGTQMCSCPDGSEACDTPTWGECVGIVTDAAEICDGLHNSCDNQANGGPVDADFALDSNDHCGGCDVQCGYFGGSPQCVEGACALNCRDGMRDSDGRPDTGCESFCSPSGDAELCDDGVDNDCDGAVDETCTSGAFAGEYDFYSIFADPATKAPGLRQGILRATSTSAAVLTDGVIYGLGMDGESAIGDAAHAVQIQGSTIALLPESTTFGGQFQGQFTGPSRDVAVFTEVTSGVAQPGVSVAIRRVTGAPISARDFTGPFQTVDFFPGRLTQGSDSTRVLNVSLDATAEGGAGYEVLSRGDQSGAFDASTPLDRRYTYEASANALTLRRFRDRSSDTPTELYQGSSALAGSFSVLTRSLREDGPAEPGLSVMVHRRDQVLSELGGRWFLIGMRSKTDNATLVHRGEQLALRFTGEGDLLSVLDERGDVVGSASLGFDETGQSLVIVLEDDEFRGGGRWVLRARIAADRQTLVAWESDEDGQQVPGLFFGAKAD